MYGQSYHVKTITIGDLAARTTTWSAARWTWCAASSPATVSILTGTGSFVDPHTVEVDGGDGRVAGPPRTRS